MVSVMSSILLIISTFSNPVPRAHFMAGGTFTCNLGPVIIVGGISHPNTHPS